MTRGEQFLAEIREWEGTPFHAQAAAKGKGADCKGMLWGAARNLGFPEADTFYATFIEYDLTTRDGIPGGLLKEGMAAIFDEVSFEDRELGDILLCKWGNEPGHLAVYSGNDRAIHTHTPLVAAHGKVRENALRSLFFYYPLDSVWRWK